MESRLKPSDYKRDWNPIWCPGCGDYGVLRALYQALSMLDVPPEKVAIISGIGCSGRLPGYVKTYGFNAVHGRALPIATGVKLANPEITVIAAGGDGDGFSIGGGHVSHAARRNVDLTYLVMDNQIYGLTKGQVSPTSPFSDVTASSIYGSIDEPLNPVSILLNYGATFIAQGFAGDIKHLASLIVQAVQHRGFAFVHILSPCVTYRGKEEFRRIRDTAVYLDESYDYTDKFKAFGVSEEAGRLSLGLIYKTERPTYTDKLSQLREKAKRAGTYRVEEITEHFLP